MRTTVGPLPPAVYWRRRLVVLGALLVVVLAVAFACSGGDDPSSPRTVGSPATIPAPSSVAAQPSEAVPSFADSGPVVGPARQVTPTDPPIGGGDPSVPVDPAACTDAEMSVVPVPAAPVVRRGVPIDLRLKIRNASARGCSRDVGADWQEIYIKQGARSVWSSDQCSLMKGSEVRQLAAGEEREYRVTWNGRDSTRCSSGVAVGPVPAAGDYEVYGRIGAVVSAPVKITVVA